MTTVLKRTPMVVAPTCNILFSCKKMQILRQLWSSICYTNNRFSLPFKLIRPKTKVKEETLNAFTLTNLLATREQSGDLYHEFLRVPSMSAGVYQLIAGATDPQQPHTEDELYYIVQGRAYLKVGNEDIPIEPGSLVLVEANVEHRFRTITEDLTVLVFFAPAEYSLGK